MGAPSTFGASYGWPAIARLMRFMALKGARGVLANQRSTRLPVISREHSRRASVQRRVRGYSHVRNRS